MWAARKSFRLGPLQTISARVQCPFCQFVRQCWNPLLRPKHHHSTRQAVSGNSVFWLITRRPPWPRESEVLSGVDMLNCLPTVEAYSGAWNITGDAGFYHRHLFMSRDTSGRQIRGLVDDSKGNSRCQSTSDKRSGYLYIEMLESWVNNCKESLTVCQENRNTRTELGPVFANDVQDHNVKELPEHSKFGALSYIWGTPQPQLLRNNKVPRPQPRRHSGFSTYMAGTTACKATPDH